MKNMKYKWIKKLTTGMVILIAAGGMSGCQKAATPENLFRDLAVNMTAVESATENQIVSLQMGEGESAVSQESNLDIEMTRDPAAVHRKGQQKTDMAGKEETQELESYQVEEDGKTVIYSGTDEAWEKNDADETDQEKTASEQGNEESTASDEKTEDASDKEVVLFDGIENLSGLFTMSQELADVNNEECFELTGKISGTQFQETFMDTLVTLLGEDSSDLSGWNLKAETGEDEAKKKQMDEISIDCTLDIYRSNILPAKITFNLTDYLKAADEDNAQVSAYTLELTFVSYNDTKKIKVPKSVMESAKDNTGDAADAEDASDGAVEDEQQQKDSADKSVTSKGIQSDVEGAAAQSEELGASWNSYTVQINDKVLTLPCTIAELESAGLTFDEKSLPLDYEIKAGDYQNAWFKDDSRNTIMVDLINTGEDDKEAKDCLVGGIYVEQYSLKNDSLTVTFPGDIQLGMSIDTVLAAYGDTVQNTEGDLVNVYNWYEDGSYYNSCEIDTNSTDGTVTMMGISRFEMKKW